MGKTTGPVFATDMDLPQNARAQARAALSADLASGHALEVMVKLKLNTFNEAVRSAWTWSRAQVAASADGLQLPPLQTGTK
jgi:hypothetical protein